MGLFGKKQPSTFDTGQDKAITQLHERINKFIQAYNAFFEQTHKTLNQILTYQKQKESYDKQQDAQIADFINQFNNALKDLKANSHNHTVATETKP